MSDPELTKTRKKINMTCYIGSLLFISIMLYEIVGLWDFKHINQPFIKGVVCFGLAVLLAYMPYSFSKCKDCNSLRTSGESGKRE